MEPITSELEGLQVGGGEENQHRPEANSHGSLTPANNMPLQIHQGRISTLYNGNGIGGYEESQHRPRPNSAETLAPVAHVPGTNTPLEAGHFLDVPARLPLPSLIEGAQPIAVNNRQHYRILRRRETRAKARHEEARPSMNGSRKERAEAVADLDILRGA